MLEDIFKKLSVKIMTKYIEFVYYTSKISINGNKKQLKEECKEKVVIVFWHGDSYCLYPALKGLKMYIVTTKDRRGDYISDMCTYFGYKPLRIPDISDGGNYLFKIKKIINEEDISNIAISADGPLGPYHVIKDFSIVSAILTKRRIMPVSIVVKRKIKLTRRWDSFKIPLPFNQITITFHDPVEVNRKDRKEKFSSLKETIKGTMENEIM